MNKIIVYWFFLSFTGFTTVIAQNIPTYKNPAKPVEQRVADLLGRMTLEEKVAQLGHLHRHNWCDGQEADLQKLRQSTGGLSYGCVENINLTSANARKSFHAIQKYMVEDTRLGIPIITVTESLHGSVHDGSTIFPQSIAVSSAFNTDLAYRMTKTVAAELRAQGVIQTLSPVLDVVRDLRWGRAEETFGEDPWLNAQMGIAEVSGYLDGGISPTLKHYGPGSAPLGGLNLASVESGERDVRSIHIKPYEMVIKNTGVKTVMSSYNSWNGIPNSASRFLLTDILRGEWGFKGYVYSDWGAVSMLSSFQRTAKDSKEAAVQALLAGLDVEAGGDCLKSLISLVKSGQLDEKYVDIAVERVLRVKFELGLFENPYPEIDVPENVVHSEEAVALSRQIADESIVLLKNENRLLPLNVDNIRSLAVIGPNADQVQFGDYTWSRSNADGVTPLEGIRRLAGDKVKIHHAKGCDLI
ncbi:MAG: glycoside hydrolase family 3 protein, partial [Prevotellaceae bacterium]|nr:glycoside hydrolase family 3 protein [Prevotellaceae bacterium]